MKLEEYINEDGGEPSLGVSSYIQEKRCFLSRHGDGLGLEMTEMLSSCREA